MSFTIAIAIGCSGGFLAGFYAGWFSGAMDWVGQATGQTWKTHSEETRCAAEGHAHCVFTVTPIAH